MKLNGKITLSALVVGTLLATSAFAQSARDIRGASPYETIQNEPAPKLIVDPPLPGPLAEGVFQAQYRGENLRILPVFGAGALQASPRIGHLHVIVDDLPWCGRMRATTTRSTSPACRRARTR